MFVLTHVKITTRDILTFVDYLDFLKSKECFDKELVKDVEHLLFMMGNGDTHLILDRAGVELFNDVIEWGIKR